MSSNAAVSALQDEEERERLEAAQIAVEIKTAAAGTDRWTHAAVDDPSVARIKTSIDRLHARTSGRVPDMASASATLDEERMAHAAWTNSPWAVPGASLEAAKGLVGRAQPWRTLLDIRALSLPNGWLDLGARVRKNLLFFAINYVVLVLGMMAMLLAFRPTTLGMLTALGMLWMYVLHVRRDEMNVLGVRLGVRAQAIALLVLTLGVVFFLTNAAAMLSSVCSAGVAVAVVHSALRKPQQDIQAEAEGDGTLYKGFTSFVESNLSNEALSKVSLDSIKSTFKLPDNPFTRKLERGVDGLWAGVEKGLNL